MNLWIPADDVIFVLSNFNSIMKLQRIINLAHPCRESNYSFNLDSVTSELNRQGWTVVQIVSTSFKDGERNGITFPVISITLLVEKA